MKSLFLKMVSFNRKKILHRVFLSLFIVFSLAVSQSASSQYLDATSAQLKEDIRLDKKVTLHGIGVPLTEILERIKQQSGVSVTAAQEIEDDRYTVLLDEIPIRGVIRALSEPFQIKLKVQKPKGKPRLYHFLRPQATRLATLQLQAKDMEAFKSRVNTLALYGHAADSKDQHEFLQAHPELLIDKPVTLSSSGFLGGRSWRVGLFATGLTSQQWDQLVKGDKVTRWFSDFSEFSHQLLSETLFEGIRDSLGLSEICSDCPTATNLAHQLLLNAKVTLWMDSDLPDTDRAMHVRLYNVNLQPLMDQGFIPGPVLNRYRSNFQFGGIGPLGSFGTVVHAEVTSAKNDRTKQRWELEPSLDTKIPMFPKQSETISLEDRRHSWRILWELHRALKIPIVADYRIYRGGVFDPLSGNDTLGDAIDWFTVAYHSDWKPVRNIHTFRDKYWYMTDANEVSTSALRRWRKTAKDAKKYSVDEIAEITQLKYTQIASLEGYQILPGIALPIHDPDELASFRLWGSLSKDQRAAALADGLACEYLTEAQKNYFLDGDRLQDMQLVKIKAQWQPDETLNINYYSFGEEPAKMILSPRITPEEMKPPIKSTKDKASISLPQEKVSSSNPNDKTESEKDYWDVPPPLELEWLSMEVENRHRTSPLFKPSLEEKKLLQADASEKDSKTRK